VADVRSLWTPEEAWDYLNQWHYHMDKMEPWAQADAVNELMKMKHRPHCRKNLEHVFPNYGSECTCDAKYEDAWHE
jgi:hypothetical protein